MLLSKTVRPRTTVPFVHNPKHSNPYSIATMSSSLTLEQVAETVLKEKAELEAKVKYLQTQPGQLLEEKRRSLRNSRSPTEQRPQIDLEGDESYLHESSS